MSYTELLSFGADGEAKCFAEVRNSYRGAMAVWRIMEERYLPPFMPSWGRFDRTMKYSRTINEDSIKKIMEVRFDFSNEVARMDF